MKKAIVAITTILLISMVIGGGSMALFTSNPDEEASDFDLGIVEMNVIKKGTRSIQVQNTGTSKAYVRVRLVPQWSDPSLSVSNVKLNFSSANWTSKQPDGYYYYKYPLKANEITNNLTNSLNIKTLAKDYENATFNLKVVAEGVQVANQGWKRSWGLNSLPFPTN